MKLKENETLFRISDACRILNISRQGVYVAIKKKKLVATKIGNRFFFKKSVLFEYLNNKYNRDLRKKDGECIFDLKKGTLSVSQATRVYSVGIGYPCSNQRIYYLLRTGQIKASRVGAAWVVDRKSLLKCIEREINVIEQYGS